MSELINNREMRKNTLKDIIKQLHEGKSVDEVKKQFEETFGGVSAEEISEAENALVREGLPVTEIQKLCDVHASVFKGSIHDIHKPQKPKEPQLEKGHPIAIMKAENRHIETIMEKKIRPNLVQLEISSHYENLLKGMEELSKITIHYEKKENLLFPYLEKYGVTAPPKVMWGVDDEIRTQLKAALAMLRQNFSDKDELVLLMKGTMERIKEMIFKEEHILFPMLLDKLTEDEWRLIAKESREFGYLVESVPAWKEAPEEAAVKAERGEITLPTGHFTIEELTCMLNTLPFDITFVDRKDFVKYFSEGKDRIFARTKTVIGRTVSNCHPPASVHIVEQIVEDFKCGKKDHEDFWIHMGDKLVLIRYFAVRNVSGEYIGVLEVTEDIKGIQAITGEKRLVE